MGEQVAYPIGEQDFRNLRSDGLLYVDKTQYIRTLIESKNKYFFLARPRRFGKSLFLSTLEYFFRGERNLFKGLAADDMDWSWERYPVLRLDFNKERYIDRGFLEPVLEEMFSKWEAEYGMDVNARIGYAGRLKRIIEAAHKKTGKQVIVLVDEYDKPLVGNLNNTDNLKHYQTQLAALYSNFKSSAEHLRFVFITGVSRFGKLSVFSELNNLNDITFDPAYADICGITETELRERFKSGISRLAGKMDISYAEALRALKENYDGYRFAETGSDIYNPWSVLNCLSKSKIFTYWAMTGVPTIIAEALKREHLNLEEAVNAECGANELIGLDLDNLQPIALMYQTGYSTIKHYDKATDIYTLGIPNKEVQADFFQVLLPYYVDSGHGNISRIVSQLTLNLLRGEAEEMMKRMQTFFASVPYEMKMDNENNFQNAFYILMSLIGVKSRPEVHTSYGRIDLLIENDRFVYIIELKYDRPADEALRQINDKQYERPLALDGRKLFKIGVAFSSKTRTIEDWRIE